MTESTQFTVPAAAEAVAAVIGDRDGAILVHGDGYPVRISGDRLVDAVVNHLLNEVIRPVCLGIHSGAFSHRLKSCQDFDRRGIVISSH